MSWGNDGLKGGDPRLVFKAEIMEGGGKMVQFKKAISDLFPKYLGVLLCSL